MASSDAERRQRGDTEAPVPVMQEIFDNIWLIFLASLLLITVAYLIWGLIDMVSRPVLM